MADGVIQVPVDDVGKKIDTAELTVNSQTVERQRVALGDNTTAGNYAAISAAGRISVDASGVAVPITDNSGSLTVDGTVTTVGAAASGAALSGNPVLTAGSDGTNARTIRTDNNGFLRVAGTVSDGGAVPGISLSMGGSDGTNLRPVAVTAGGLVKVDDGGGSLTVDGTVAVSGTVAVTDNSGSLTVDAPVGTPAFVRLSDGSAAQIGQKVAASSLPVVLASDQTAVSAVFSDASNSGSITTQNLNPFTGAATAGSTVALTALNNAASVTVGITGTWTGQLSVQFTVDGARWEPTPVSNTSGTDNLGNILHGVTPGNWVAAVPAASQVRVTATAAITGTATVAIRVGSSGARAVQVYTPLGSPLSTRLYADSSGNAVDTTHPISVRLSDGSGNIGLGQQAMAASLPVVLASNQASVPVAATTAGDIANDAADSGNPVKTGGVARSADVTNMTAGDRAQFMTDLQGRQVVFPYCLPDNLVDGSTAAIVNTTGVDIIAAQAAGVRIYITSLTVINSHATVDSVVEMRDGTTTVKHRGFAKAAGGGYTIQFPAPIRGTAATAMRAYVITTGSNIYVSASGFISNT